MCIITFTSYTGTENDRISVPSYMFQRLQFWSLIDCGTAKVLSCTTFTHKIYVCCLDDSLNTSFCSVTLGSKTACTSTGMEPNPFKSICMKKQLRRPCLPRFNQMESSKEVVSHQQLWFCCVFFNLHRDFIFDLLDPFVPNAIY